MREAGLRVLAHHLVPEARAAAARRAGVVGGRDRGGGAEDEVREVAASTVESEPIAEALAIIDKSLMNLVKRDSCRATRWPTSCSTSGPCSPTVDADEN